MQASSVNPLLELFHTPHDTFPFDEIKTEHYQPAFEKAMEIHNKEIERIIDCPDRPNFENTIAALDYSGDLLEKVSSVFFNLLNADANEEMMALAQELQPLLTEHANNITLNTSLFEKVKQVHDECAGLDMPEEEKMLSDRTYDDFVDSGAGLNEEDKKKYRELSSELGRMTLVFGQNTLRATHSYDMTVTDRDRLSGIPENILQAAALKAKEKNKEGWVFDLTYPSYVPFMKYADDRELRKELYMAYNTRCVGGEFDNTVLITEIINTRLSIANLLGYETYADYVLRKRMAANTKNVFDLLNQLLSGYETAAKEEYHEVLGFAIGKGNRYTNIMPYDWSYYSNQLKDMKFGINDELLRPFFELEKVKKGVFGLATSLYGITFRLNKEIPVYAEGVEAYEVFDQDGSYLAVLYVDFHPREGKQQGAWMTEFQGQYKKGGKNFRPQVSLVMNFTKPTKDKPVLLTFDELRTFLHEFGHSLHGMFADTTYPGLSGTSVYRDFVELPSQIMENFLTEKVYLDTFAEDYRTGEKIPESLVKKIKDSANFNTGYACLRQLGFSFLDMDYHTIKKPYEGNAMDFERKSMGKTEILPPIAGTMMSSAFDHIFSGGYAAGYYSYKWAEVLDADAYELFKENGVISEKVADSFRKNILSKGGTEDPMSLYIKFRGRKPTVDALLRRNGIVL